MGSGEGSVTSRWSVRAWRLAAIAENRKRDHPHNEANDKNWGRKSKSTAPATNGTFYLPHLLMHIEPPDHSILINRSQ